MPKTRATSPGGTYIFSGTLAARPAAGVVNRYYWAEDVRIMFRDTGVVWQVVRHDFTRIINSLNNEFPFTEAGLQAAINELVNGGVVYIPEGTIDLTGWITNGGNDGITLQGVGHGVYSNLGITKLRLADGVNLAEMLSFTGNDCHLRDFCIDGNKTNNLVAGVGLHFNGYDCSIENVGVLNTRGVGVTWQNFASYAKNLYVETAAGNPGMNVLYSADVNAGCFNVFENLIIWDNEQSGLQFHRTNHNIVLGGQITKNGFNGLSFWGGHDNIIAATMFENNGNAADNTYDQISIASDGVNYALDNIISSCRMESTHANKPAYNVNEADADCDRNLIIGNHVSDAATAQIRLQGTNSIAVNNPGFNPQAAAVPAVGASPVTFGPYFYPMYIEVAGGAGVGIVVRGQATTLVEGMWLLYPGDTMVITYTGVPVVTTWPQ